MFHRNIVKSVVVFFGITLRGLKAVFLHTLEKVGVTRFFIELGDYQPVVYFYLILHLTKHCHRLLARVAFSHSHAAFLEGEFQHI